MACDRPVMAKSVNCTSRLKGTRCPAITGAAARWIADTPAPVTITEGGTRKATDLLSAPDPALRLSAIFAKGLVVTCHRMSLGMGNKSGRLRRKLNRQAGPVTTEPRKPGSWKGLTEARMPHFALDSVVVTVDGWDHLFITGSKLAYCRFFFGKILPNCVWKNAKRLQ